MHYGGRQPPQAFVARLNRFLQESRPVGFSLSIKWMEDESVCPPPKRRHTGGKQLDPAAVLALTILTFTYADRHIRGITPYWVNPLTKPTALTVCAHVCGGTAPDVLVGSSATDLNNVSKQYSLYRKFWALLSYLRQTAHYIKHQGGRGGVSPAALLLTARQQHWSDMGKGVQEKHTNHEVLSPRKGRVPVPAAQHHHCTSL